MGQKIQQKRSNIIEQTASWATTAHDATQNNQSHADKICQISKTGKRSNNEDAVKVITTPDEPRYLSYKEIQKQGGLFNPCPSAFVMRML